MVIIFEKFRYFLRCGMRNLIGGGATSLASVGTVTATLILLGLFIAVGMNVNAMIDRLGDSREINVYISRDGGGRSIDELEAELKAIDGVSEVRFFSREDRLSKASKEVYGEEYTFVGGENPLRDSYILTISDSLYADGICAAAEAVAGVEETVKSSEVLTGINLIIDGVGTVGLWLMLLMILVSMYIIRSTIRLGIEAHGDEIRIMRTIGATDGFITAPYVLQAVILALLGSLIAAVICICGYNMTVSRFAAVIPQKLVGYTDGDEVAMVILAVFPAIAVVIGTLGGLTSVRRYLKKEY